jgi:membrane-associated protease RseP (regulator of RpoE activity)
VRASGYAPFARDLTIPEDGGRRAFAIPRVELGAEGIVEGEVVDARGDPVQGARVAKDHVPTYLAVGSTPAGVAVTNAKGRFTLRELAPGTLSLEAYAPDVGRTRQDDVRVSAGRTTTNVRIVLVRGSDATSSEPGASGGVAVTLGETAGDPREVVIVSVVDGSAAERAGLAPDDTIVAVDGTPVHTIEETRAKLSGPIADDVVVRIRRGDKTSLVRVSREQVRR